MIREWSFQDAPPVNSALFFLKDFILKELANTNLFNDLTFLKPNQVEVYYLTDDEYDRFSQVFLELFRKSTMNSLHQASIIALNIASLLYQIDEIHQNNNVAIDADLSRPQILVNQFIDLVNQNFISNRKVGFYARQLHISPKYLSQIVVEKTGQRPMEFIRSKIILEAKVLLQDNQKSISEISHTLQFASPTQFGKYFRKYTGISPGSYRKDR